MECGVCNGKGYYHQGPFGVRREARKACRGSGSVDHSKKSCCSCFGKGWRHTGFCRNWPVAARAMRQILVD